MGGWGKIIGFLRGDRDSASTQNIHRRVLVASGTMSLLLFLAVVFYLRQVSVAGSPQSYLYLEIGGTLVSFCYAAIALVRFRGTHDRTALILAFGFVLSGIIETVGCFGLNDSLISGALALSRVPMGWMVSRTLLAILLLAAIVVERYMPTARQPSKETAAALLVVALAAYMTSAAFLAAPAAPLAHAAKLLSRPWDLLPAALFLIAAVCFRQRLKNDRDKKGAASLFDHSLFIVAALNVACHASAAFSRQLFDGPFFLAELSKTFSYVVMLSGALLDQARLFEQVRSMAVTDPLTGLSNYRRLISAHSPSCFSTWTASRSSTITTGISPGAAPWCVSLRFCAIIPARSTRPRDTAAMNSRWYYRKPARTSPHASSLESASVSPLSRSSLRLPSARGLRPSRRMATRRRNFLAPPTARSTS